MLLLEPRPARAPVREHYLLGELLMNGDQGFSVLSISYFVLLVFLLKMLHEVHLALSLDLAREVCWRLRVTRPQRHARDSVVLFLAGAASAKHDRWFEAVEDINVDTVVRYLFGN